jgi:hypothetical protein
VMSMPVFPSCVVGSRLPSPFVIVPVLPSLERGVLPPSIRNGMYRSVSRQSRHAVARIGG